MSIACSVRRGSRARASAPSSACSNGPPPRGRPTASERACRPGGSSPTAVSHSSAAQGMVRQALDVLGQAIRVELFDRSDDAGMERPAALLEQAAVRHVVGQGVLERVLRLREEADCIAAARRPGAGTAAACRSASGVSAMAWSSANGTSLPITAAVWSRRFSSGGRRSMRAASTACTVAGTRMLSTGRISR